MSSPTMANAVMEQIRRDILSGELKPEQKLVVAELKDRYRVGASPIREALVQLSWRKYVEFLPQKGCWVAPISLNELDQLFEASRILSHFLLQQAIENGTEEWELGILTNYHKISRLNPASVEVDLNEWELRHREFHMSLMASDKSKVMLSFYHDIYEQIERYRHIWISRQRDYQNRYHDNGEHKAIMQAVLDRNVTLAQELVDTHTQRARDMIAPYL